MRRGGRRRSSASCVRGCWPTSCFVDQNPIENLKVLYGTGWMRVNDATGAVERIGGIKYVMKDGILYDAKKLLHDVEVMVQNAKAAEAKK